MDKRKIFLIIGFLVVVAGLGWLIWLIFFQPAPPVMPIVPEEEEVIPRLPVSRTEWERMTIKERETAGLPKFEWPEEEEAPEVLPEEITVPKIDQVAEGGRTWVNPVSTDPVQAPILAADGEHSLYYNREEGRFYQIDVQGHKELLTEERFYNLENINWAPTKDRAILEYPDGFKVMYDFDQDKQYTLPKNWEEFSWDPVGSRLAFKATSDYPENNWLAVSKADGSQAEPVEHMGDNADKVTVSWSPNNQVIGFSATGEPRGTWEQEILLLGKNQENFKSLVIDGRGFEPEWSPQGDKIAYSVYSADSGYQPRLYLVDGDPASIGANKIELNLATWAHKCAFNDSGSTLYCAVPRELPEGAGLVPELGDETEDDFYKIDVATGEINFLAEGAMGGYDVEDIYVSDDEKYLYFVDQDMGRLRYIQLEE